MMSTIYFCIITFTILLKYRIDILNRPNMGTSFGYNEKLSWFG